MDGSMSHKQFLASDTQFVSNKRMRLWHTIPTSSIACVKTDGQVYMCLWDPHVRDACVHSFIYTYHHCDQNDKQNELTHKQHI